MITFLVDSEEEKQELLDASEHIHWCDINTDIPMVNTLSHLYMAPFLIKVNGIDNDYKG